MATNSQTSVVALFSTQALASQAIQALKNAGFTASQIGAATSADTPDTQGSLGTESTGTTNAAGTGSHVSAAAGGMWDKVKNFFEGNEEGGVEQYADERARDNSSHEITGGYGAGGYDTGDVSHSLEGMSVPSEHSRYFEHRLSSGNTSVLVTVTAPGREQEAATILTQAGGDLGAESGSYDYSAAPAAEATAVTGQQRIQLLGEVLRVHKDRVSRGEVRIRKEIITEQQTVQVPVSREELVIERIPTTGQAAVHGAIGQDSEIRIPLSEEVASAEKQTLVREEVAIGKRAIEGVQEVGGSIRHEELEVEDGTTEVEPTIGRSTGTINRS